jgi:hypothetical protein
LLFQVVEDTSYVYSDGKPDLWTPEAVKRKCVAFQELLIRERNDFVSRNQDIFMQALKEGSSAQEESYA